MATPAGQPRREPDQRGGTGAVLLLFVLLLGLGAFGVWNTWRAEARAADQLSALERTMPGEPLPPGWGAFVVGRPSGAEPLEVEPELRTALEFFEILPSTDGGTVQRSAGEGRAAPATLEEFELSPVSDFELVVEPGQVLSRIVQVYYGAAEPELVQGLAEYNGLASPDLLRAGATVRLPSERRLRALVAE